MATMLVWFQSVSLLATLFSEYRTQGHFGHHMRWKALNNDHAGLHVVKLTTFTALCGQFFGVGKRFVLTTTYSSRNMLQSGLITRMLPVSHPIEFEPTEFAPLNLF